VSPQCSILTAAPPEVGEGWFLAIKHDTVLVFPQLPAAHENEGRRRPDGDAWRRTKGVQLTDGGSRERGSTSREPELSGEGAAVDEVV
jgi:hypothetical protein